MSENTTTTAIVTVDAPSPRPTGDVPYLRPAFARPFLSGYARQANETAMLRAIGALS